MVSSDGDVRASPPPPPLGVWAGDRGATPAPSARGTLGNGTHRGPGRGGQPAGGCGAGQSHPHRVVVRPPPPPHWAGGSLL